MTLEMILVLGLALSAMILFATEKLPVDLTAMIILPVALTIAKDCNLGPGRLLMPLSFASMFGGVCTLVGTSMCGCSAQHYVLVAGHIFNPPLLAVLARYSVRQSLFRTTPSYR